MLNAVTHSGSFHADDVFAYAILKAATDGAVQLTRTRDESLMTAADVLFDVGGIFDPAKGRYDHHMRDKPLRPNGEPYSSAGLIWKDYGAKAVLHFLPHETAETATRIQTMLDNGLLRDVDLMDNGAMPWHAGHVSVLIETFNVSFAESHRREDESFQQASELATSILARACAHAHAAVVAEHTVAQAALAAEDPRILLLDRRVPWEDAVFDLDLKDALYVLRPAGDAWTCSAVMPERGSFEKRQPLPEAWAGLRDADFAGLTGVADATFCHPARFICGAKSREGILALAKLAVGT